MTLVYIHGAGATPDSFNFIDAHIPPIARGHRIEVTVPWTAVVTTAGRSHLLDEPNDGVVTAKSMRQRQGVEFVEVETGHHEILMRRQTVEIIQARLELLSSEVME